MTLQNKTILAVGCSALIGCGMSVVVVLMILLLPHCWVDSDLRPYLARVTPGMPYEEVTALFPKQFTKKLRIVDRNMGHWDYLNSSSALPYVCLWMDDRKTRGWQLSPEWAKARVYFSTNNGVIGIGYDSPGSMTFTPDWGFQVTPKDTAIGIGCVPKELRTRWIKSSGLTNICDSLTAWPTFK